jgi:hypothetical protein
LQKWELLCLLKFIADQVEDGAGSIEVAAGGGSMRTPFAAESNGLAGIIRPPLPSAAPLAAGPRPLSFPLRPR